MEGTENTQQPQDISSIAAPVAPVVQAAAQENQALKNLKPGETLLVKARGVKGDKVELEFAEIIKNPDVSLNSNPLVGLLNASDARFSKSGGPRRAWITGTKVDISAMLGIDVTSLTLGQEMAINKLNPTMGGVRLRLQVIETVTPDSWQSENIETAAKRKGADGDYILHNGMYIFSNVRIIPASSEVEHTFLKADASATTGGIVAGAQASADALVAQATGGLAI